MATILLNDFERNLLFQTFRRPGRQGTRKDVRATRRLMRAMGEENWQRRIDGWDAEAKQKEIAEVVLPNGTAYNPYVNERLNQSLKRDAPEVEYVLDYACAEYLNDEMEKLDKAGLIPLHVDKWHDILDKAEETWKAAKEEGPAASKSDGAKAPGSDAPAAHAP